MKLRWSVLKISLTVILAFSFLTITTGFLVYKNINVLLGFWGKSATMTVYLKPDILEKEKNQLISKVQSFIEVERADFISRDQAANDFKASMGEYASGLLTQDDLIDLLPESLVVYLKSDYTSVEKKNIFGRLQSDLKFTDSVEDVTFGGAWITKFSKVDHFLRLSGAVIVSLIFLCVAVISAFLVSSLVEESKQEIEVYYLVGATRWLIYKNFFRQIGLFHLISLALALVGSAGVFFLVKKFFLKANDLVFISDTIIYLSFVEILLFSVIITGIIFLGAFLALRHSLGKLNLYAAD